MSNVLTKQSNDSIKLREYNIYTPLYSYCQLMITKKNEHIGTALLTIVIRCACMTLFQTSLRYVNICGRYSYFVFKCLVLMDAYVPRNRSFTFLNYGCRHHLKTCSRVQRTHVNTIV